MNIIKHIISHVESKLLESKTPYKFYKSYERCEKAISEMADECARHFELSPNANEQAQYVVVYIEKIDRYVGAINMSELFNRHTSGGGYLPLVAERGHVTF